MTFRELYRKLTAEQRDLPCYVRDEFGWPFEDKEVRWVYVQHAETSSKDENVKRPERVLIV